MSNSIFTKVLNPPVQESKFNLSHDIKLSFNMGQLIPSCVFDVLPGDKFNINVESMLRFSALISPVMHKIKVITNFFFVPNRILWATDHIPTPSEGWEPFITGENTDDPPPTFNQMSTITAGKLGDYLGYPTGHANSDTYEVSAFPVAAYVKIYDYWYRDENLQPEIFIPLTTGTNTAYKVFATNDPFLRAKNHDYFTSALPFAQKGDSVTLPLLTNDSPLVQVKAFTDIATGITFFDPDDGTLAPLGNAEFADAASGLLTSDGDGEELVMNPKGTLFVDINNEASTVETLRSAFRLQEWLEKNARGGTRYSEHLKSHFNVHAQDSRLQNPEYIGGHVQNMIISEVLNTGGDIGNAAVGDMSGHGISISKGKNFRYSAKEHGWIIGIISVTPNTAYSQGLPRMFNRNVLLDYAFPSFANLGEQEILNFEIFVGDQTATVEEGLGTFGYIPRYAEYKYVNNRVAGEFKTTLDFWHCGLEFATPPALNSDFIETAASDYDKIFAVDSSVAHTIYAHIFNNVSAIRKLPKYGIPSI